MSILKRLSELLSKQSRLSDELSEVDVEIARSKNDLLRDWLKLHPEHREGQLIDYTINAAPKRKKQIVQAKVHHVDVSVMAGKAHFYAQVFLPVDGGGWELSHRRVMLGSMEIK